MVMPFNEIVSRNILLYGGRIKILDWTTDFEISINIQVELSGRMLNVLKRFQHKLGSHQLIDSI